MPFSMKCSLCGAPAGYQQQRWLNEVRGIYVNGWEWSFPLLSGVGIRADDGADVPRLPRDRNQRYDDVNHNSGLDIYMMCSPSLSTINPAGHLSDPNDPPAWLAPWDTLIHDACWNILVHACFPHEVDIATLHRFCVSCPMGYFLIDWGHDYGGIYDCLPESNNPLDLCFSRLIKFKRTAYELYNANPFEIPELTHLLARSINSRGEFIAPLQEGQTDKAIESSSTRSITMTNCFSKLPKEVIEFIAINLPSKDVISFRASVRAVGSMPLSQTFWASRFTSGFEFQHIFEVRNEVQSAVTRTNYRDWKSLFNGLKGCVQVPAFQNRKRTWSLLRPFGRVLQLTTQIECEGEPIATFYEPYLKPRIADCVSLEAAIGPNDKRLREGCKIMFTRQICLGHVKAVYVSSIFFVHKQYISGIRFLHADGTEVKLGYILKGRETFVDILGNAETSDGLGGFILALTPRGINAISLIAVSGRVSDWAGCCKDYPRKSLLLSGGPFHQLRADFDGFKMISLGILQNVQDI